MSDKKDSPVFNWTTERAFDLCASNGIPFSDYVEL